MKSCCWTRMSTSFAAVVVLTAALVATTTTHIAKATSAEAYCSTTSSSSLYNNNKNINHYRRQQRLLQLSPLWGPLSSQRTTTATLITTTTRGGATTKTTSTAIRMTAASSVPSGGDTTGAGGTATIPNLVFNLVKSIVGAGVLSLPYGVAVFGNAPSALVPAIALIAIMGIISAYTFSIIGRICQSTQTESYADAWDVSVGTQYSKLIAFSCFIDCFAGNLSYSMILADTIKNLLSSIGYSMSRTNALLAVTTTILLPLCLLKNLASLAPFSLVGIMGMLYTTIAMGLRYYQKAYVIPTGIYAATQLTPPIFGSMGSGTSALRNPATLILACMLSNAYIAHFNAPKFLKELKNNTMNRFHQVIAWSFGTSIAVYALITAFGFLTFGGASNGLILNNYSTQDVIMSLSRIAVAVSITCSYPLIFVGCRDGILDLFNIKSRTNTTLNQVTVAIMALITALASQLTDLGLVASVGGATFGTALVFVYPVIMFLKSQTKRTRETIPAAAIGIMGVIMGIVGTVLSFQGK